MRKNSFGRLVKLKDDLDMQIKWRYFLKNIKNNLLDFAIVINDIEKFLKPIFDSIVNENEWQKIWNSKTQSWS